MVKMSEINEQTNIQDPYISWGYPDEIDLCDASHSGDLKRISKQIGNGVNVNFIDGFGKCPLHYASSNGSYEAVKLLVANKANVNVTDSNFTTPLHMAARGNHVRVVKFLLMCGADSNKECLSGCKPIDLAPYNSESWNILINASNGQLPNVDHLVQTCTISLVPQFAIQREIDKKHKEDEKKTKSSAKNKKSGNKVRKK